MSPPLTTGQKQRARIAMHEAGHAVAALLMQVRVRYATVRPTDRRLAGGVTHDPPRSAVGSALISAAGIAAETIAFGGYQAPGAAQDLEELRRLASKTGDGLSPDGTVRLYVGLAQGRLKENWRVVEAVRDGLLRHDALDGPSVERLARKVGLRIRTSAKRRREELEPLVIMDPRPAPRLVRIGNQVIVPTANPWLPALHGDICA